MSNKYGYQVDSFQNYVSGRRIPFRGMWRLFLNIFPELIEFAIRYIPGPVGFVIRRFYYKFRLKSLGQNCLIDIGVIFQGAKNISIADWVWIDANVRLEATLGEISIGSRVHIAPFVVIGSREAVEIGDYCAIASGAKIYANSEVPIDGLHMSGPMVPENEKGFFSQKIVMMKDSLVGANAVMLPGSSLDEGAILGALSLLKEKIPEWEIWGGVPAKKISERKHSIPTRDVNRH